MSVTPGAALTIVFVRMAMTPAKLSFHVGRRDPECQSESTSKQHDDKALANLMASKRSADVVILAKRHATRAKLAVCKDPHRLNSILESAAS